MYFRIDLFLDINLYCNIRYVFLSFDQIKTHYYYYYYYYIDMKESFTNVEIMPMLSVLRYFHASSVGLRYSLVFICFSFFFSIELVTKRNRYICGGLCKVRMRTADGTSLTNGRGSGVVGTSRGSWVWEWVWVWVSVILLNKNY